MTYRTDRYPRMLGNSTGNGGASPSSSPAKYAFQASMLGLADAKEGFLSLSPVDTANPSGLPITRSGSGYYNGSVSPFEAPCSIEICKVTVVMSAAAVSQASVGASPIIRIPFYSHDNQNRTLIQNVDVPILDGTVQVYNTLTDQGLVRGTLELETCFNIDCGSLFGFQFTNLSTSNNNINSARGITVTATGQETT